MENQGGILMKIRKIISSTVITVLAAASLQAAQPPAAEAGGLDGILGSFITDILDADEEGIQETYKSMVDNYYAAAYYSNRAAVVGSELLSKYGVNVRTHQAAMVNSSTDNSDDMVQKTAKMQITTIDTDLKELSDFVKVTKKFDPNDDLIRRFRLNKEFQEKALNDAKSDTAALIGKQFLIGKAGDAIVQCITTALWYNEVQSQFEAATGNSCNLLNKAIKKNFKVEIDKDLVKDAIKNVPKG